MKQTQTGIPEVENKQRSDDSTLQAQEPERALAVQDSQKKEQLTEWAEGIAFIQKHLNDKKLDLPGRAKLELALRRNPNLWSTIGDLAVQTENNMIEKMTSQAVVEVALKHGIARIREELGEKDAPMLEKLLIDSVILCWLNMNSVQRAYDHQMLGSGVITLTAGMYWEKRLTLAQSRYAKAVETLAKVRKLSRATPLQVNIGGQQINVAGSPVNGTSSAG